MLIKYKDVKTKEEHNKIKYVDDLIDKRFVMDYMNCSEQQALRYIRLTNKWVVNNTTMVPEFLPRGTTTLKWFWKCIGVSAEFI